MGALFARTAKSVVKFRLEPRREPEPAHDPVLQKRVPSVIPDRFLDMTPEQRHAWMVAFGPAFIATVATCLDCTISERETPEPQFQLHFAGQTIVRDAR